MRISQLQADSELHNDAWFPVAREGKNYRVSGATLRQMFAASNHTHSADDIVSGTLNVARIPSLHAALVNSGVFDAARIPSLPASRIGSGTLDAARIPSLPASQIGSGVFPVARLGGGVPSASTFLRGDGTWAVPPAGSGGGGGGGMQTWYAALDPSVESGGYVQFSWNEHLVIVELCLPIPSMLVYTGPGRDLSLQGTTMPQEVYEFLSGGGLVVETMAPGLYAIPMHDILGDGATGFIMLGSASEPGQTTLGLRGATQTSEALAGWRGTAVFHRLSVS
ncbi:hypothetical protein ANDA3_3735 [plant metagenome]|uniref:Uncharacterized protein n=1 Tax=plant metagenome TaxID=1297885 RepID=A0A484TF93_9ZZZZ